MPGEEIRGVEDDGVVGAYSCDFHDFTTETQRFDFFTTEIQREQREIQRGDFN